MGFLEIFTDRYMIWIVEVALLLLVLYAAFPTGLLRRLFDMAATLVRRPLGEAPGSGLSASATLSVKRGSESWSYVLAVYSGFHAVVFAIPLAVESAKPYRITLSLVNVAAALYLCFVNTWFRGKVIKLVIKMMNRPD